MSAPYRASDDCCGGCGGCRDTCAARQHSSPPHPNQPGLDALTYRVGTHPDFFATMRNRLGELLPALRTRDLDDPAVAFLDAWAVVADVLTFYQERIANEGYLRTATERRSLLELARLVGYRPRPGVAADAFLAFTLEAGYRGEVPAGTRAQSRPTGGGPPQPYETGSPLPARAEWNLLAPRLTRPQVLSGTDRGDGTSGPFHLDGVRTGLRPNDPLLLDLGGSDQRLYRVLAVTPDPAAGRTRADVERWIRDRTPAARRPSAAALLQHTRHAVRDALERGEKQPRPGVTWQKALALLRVAQTQADVPVPDEFLTGRVLSGLRSELDRAAQRRHVRLRAWLEGFVPELERLTSELDAVRDELADPAAVPGRVPGFFGVARLADALAKPPSRPPADPSRMPRAPRESYAATGDALPRLLSAVRPDLGAVLYGAWRKLPRGEPVGQRLFALRVRARLFGHNAPPRTAEKFTVAVPRTDGTERLLTYTVSIGGHSVTVRARTNDTTVTPFDAVAETVETTLSGFGESVRPVAVIVLKRRRVTVTARLRPGDPMGVECVGSDPTTVVRVIDDPSPEAVAGRSPEVIANPSTEAVADPSPGAVADRPDLTVSGEVQGDFPLREEPRVLTLDAVYPQILPGSWVAVQRAGGGDSGRPPEPLLAKVLTVHEVTRSNYGVASGGTQLLLDRAWTGGIDSLAALREVTVHAQSEPLALSPAPLDPVREAICGDLIELDGLYDGLEPGRRVIVSGERTDVPGVAGLQAAELAMTAGVEQVVPSDPPGDFTRTVLRLAEPLAYCYRRDTAKIYGNVAHATHGETRTEVLGSGDAGSAGQRFALRHAPLTHVPAPTATGTESTLRTRVAEILWHEAADLAGAGPTDHGYRTATDDEQRTTLLFGDGRHGARLPTGVENVSAQYRTGIGRAGNTEAGRISLLATRPLGVREVVNPLPATGGADREGHDQLRRNAPLGVTALDRLVSVRDHADFARTFAGIGKAAAVRLSDGSRELVHVTVAGVDDIPISATSGLYGSLVRALHRFGDPGVAVQVGVRELRLLVITGQVRVTADHRWKSVEPRVRAALLRTFGFERRELAQDALLSEALTAIQAVEGVDHADVDLFTGVDETALLAALAEPEGLFATLTREQRVRAAPARRDRRATGPASRIRPAQLVVLDPRVPDALILTERTT
ncbi:putative baseplate assembly protein [Streptomyces sp. NBC_00237]|uniref:putative baseplate assembly protein n=1 Tax=Streptomyces sp. NBC_00237 TaxID=2975687 RepID=UPI00225232B2|nr:putative baseplate assembly protein [Streptomyces sp. NBC_00237]MCX5205368.1 putative baseplate assembly protein [Streptomyces sp. NBC_00237]